MAGLNKYDQKQKREQRRKNRVDLDVWTTKYKKQITPKDKEDDDDSTFDLDT